MILNLSNSFDLKKAESYFLKLKKDGERIELKKFHRPKTVSQSAYLHVVIGMFSNETGYSVDEVKELISHHLPETLRYSKNGHSFRKSTNDLSTVEMSKLIDHIRNVALSELGLYIPESSEYLINKFEIDRGLNNAKI